MNERKENIGKKIAAMGGPVGVDRGSNITDEIGTLESNVNTLFGIASFASDLRKKINNDDVGSQCDAVSEEVPVPSDMKNRLSAANQSIRSLTEEIRQNLSLIEEMLGV